MKLLSGPFIAVLFIICLVSGIAIYSGIFPPASVVESGSMQHYNSWQYGAINTGDIIVVKKLANPVNDITTYVQGRQTGFSTYGDYGNVMLYSLPSGDIVIHRAMFYLAWSGGLPKVSGFENQSWITVTDSYVLIKDVGYDHRNLVVYVSDFYNESGFITMGDHNLATSTIFISSLNAYEAVDENVNIIGHPVITSEVVGKAVGHIPWLGLIKLNVMKLQGDWPYSSDVPAYSYYYLAASVVLFLVVVFFPYSRLISRKTKKNNKKQ